jgi:hypothetical protein
MKLNRKFLAAASLVLAIAPTALMGSASAQIAGFTPHKDSKGAVYFTGAPNSELTVTMGGLNQTRNISANACGVATIKPSATRPIPAQFMIGTNTVAVASLPTQLLPKCLASGQLEEARTSNFKTADGTVVVVGQTPSASVQMSFLGGRERKVKMNACGFGKINNSSTNPFTADASFTPTGGSAITYGSLAEKAPYLCRDNITYMPMI